MKLWSFKIEQNWSDKVHIDLLNEYHGKLTLFLGGDIPLEN